MADNQRISECSCGLTIDFYDLLDIYCRLGMPTKWPTSPCDPYLRSRIYLHISRIVFKTSQFAVNNLANFSTKSILSPFIKELNEPVLK